MKKTFVLETLERAKEFHLEQMEIIESLLDGKKVVHSIPLEEMELEFDTIFHKDRDVLLYILGAQFYERLDALHINWHQQYAKIHAIYFDDKSKGFFANFFGSHKVDAINQKRAEIYYKDLGATTGELLRVIDASMRRIDALNDSKFKS